MKTTRKNFLATVAGSLAAAVLRPGDLLAAPPDAFEPHHFRGLVGEPFVFDPGDRSGPVYMVLAAYSDRAPSNGTHQFTLTFQAIHTMNDEQIEWFRAGGALNIIRKKQLG